MRKYWLLFKLSWQNGLVYRLNILMWRVRQFLWSLMSLTIWATIYGDAAEIAGYSQTSMLSYIFLTALLQNLVLSSALQGLASTIYSGALSNLLLKPVKLFSYLFTQDIADKFKNILFVLVELGILFWLFKPIVMLPGLASSFWFILSSFLGLMVVFHIMLLFGALGFWSPETWAPRFLFYMLIEFTSGRFFPLDILPNFMQKLAFLTPFPYFTYVQTQIFLNRLSEPAMLSAVFKLIIWLGILHLLVRKVWQRGLKDYAAAGQ